jgi:predicted dehydrogenase
VEDDVTAYMEWDNGATGTFITSTGDAPGINRLEISLEEALVVCENGIIRIGELEQEMGGKESDYMKNSTDFFRKIKGTWTEIKPESEPAPYVKVIRAFADEINGKGKSIADGREGRKSLLLSNAIYLSSWKKEMVSIPQIGSREERAFEDEFEAALNAKIKNTL